MKLFDRFNFSLTVLSSISLLSIFFYVICISFFTFFHFHLNHDMFTINSWITENKWEILFLIKGMVWAVLVYWKSMTKPAKGLLRKFRTLSKWSMDSFFSSLLNVLAIVFFVYYEGANVLNFNFKIFFFVSIYFISDVLVFFLFDEQAWGRLRLSIAILLLSILNAVYLHIIEIFEPAFIICYIFAFAAGLSVVFLERVNKTMIFSIGVFGVALFIGLNYSMENSNRYLVELSSSKLNTLILFISIAVANYFLVLFRATRLQKLNEVHPI